MRKTVGLLTMTACLFAAPSEKDRRQAAERLTEASAVLSENMSAGDKGNRKSGGTEWGMQF